MGTGDGMIGKTVGDYLIEKQLGEGGMGVVFKGVHPTLGQIVAIKMLHPNLVKADSIKQRFVREAQAMARLRHPNILQLFNFVENAEGCFIIMEFVEGKTFESILEESGVIPPDRALELFVPMLDAMQYAHDAGIIHRDIKPSNMMLLNSGVAKMMDFGTAKVAGGSQLTAAGMTLGTVVYMSPEQLMGRDLTPAADVYSLGVTLYEMCTGRLPFYHDNEMMLMKMIMKEAPPPPSSIYPAMPKDLEKAILKSMDKTAAKRYQSCKEFKADLEKVKAGLGGAKPASNPQVAVPAAPPAPPSTPAQPTAPKTPTPPATPVPGETTSAIPAPPPAPAAAPAGTHPLVFVGGGLMGLGVLAGGGLFM
ncbi:MAG TPA: serine/threonine-protein kinase, partial [Planctomycetota bacterium]|nr:serine/threonine-protein kinase [Planctomycetota bacterium]